MQPQATHSLLVPWPASGEVSCGVQLEALLWQGLGSCAQGLCVWFLQASALSCGGCHPLCGR